MVDIGHCDLFIRFDAPGGTHFQGEGIVVPIPERIRAAARERATMSQPSEVRILQSTYL